MCIFSIWIFVLDTWFVVYRMELQKFTPPIPFWDYAGMESNRRLRYRRLLYVVRYVEYF